MELAFYTFSARTMGESGRWTHQIALCIEVSPCTSPSIPGYRAMEASGQREKSPGEFIPVSFSFTFSLFRSFPASFIPYLLVFLIDSLLDSDCNDFDVS